LNKSKKIWEIWGYLLIKLGKISDIQTVNNLTIVSVDLSPNPPPIRIGSTIYIENTGKLKINGFKIWNDQSVLDVLFEKLVKEVELGPRLINFSSKCELMPV
jgi:hypothetical protein